MRRLATALVALVLAAVACSDDGSEATTTTATTTTAAPATTAVTTTAPTTTTTTTTAAPATTAATTTTTPEPIGGPPGTPANELASFSAEAGIEVDLAGASFAIEATGVRIGSSFDCGLAASIAGLRFEERAVSDGETHWLDSGEGFEEVAATDDALASVVELCPVSESFWEDFDVEPVEPSLVGEPELLGDVATLRFDLTETVGLVQGFGLVPELEGIDIVQITLWLADPDGWLAGFAFEAFVSAEIAAESFELPVPVEEGETSRIALSVTVADPDDPGLTIDFPG